MPYPYGPKLKLGDHIGVLGVPGSGKTTFARKLTAGAQRVVYFDPQGDYEQCSVDLLSPSDLSGRVEHYRDREFLRVDIAAERTERDVSEEFKEIVYACRSIGDLVLVCDEVGDYQMQSVQTLRALHANGHKQGLVTIMVSQRAVDLPLGTRAMLTSCYSFLQTHPQDLDRLRNEFGDEFAKATATWQPGQPPIEWHRPKLYR